MKYFIPVILIFSLSTCVISLNEKNDLQKLQDEELKPPTDITIFPYSIDSAIISWQDVSNAFSYSIYSSRSEFGIYEFLKTINENTYVIPNLLIDTKYFFKISVSKNNLGESNLSPQTTIIIVNLPKPIGLIASVVSPTAINLTWTSVIDSTGYKIYRSTSSSGPYTLIGSTTEANFSDTELETGTTYYYKVSGTKNDGEGVSSDYVSAFTPVSIPSGITGVVQSMNSIRLSWDAVHKASGYNVYRSLTQNGQYNLIGTTSELFYIDDGLSQLTDYFYKISAINSNGEGSQTDFIVIAIAPPLAPQNIFSSVISSSSIKLDWENVIGATSYKIYRSTGGDYNLVGTVSANSFTNTGLSLNINYYYKISSFNLAGEGEQSTQINIIIQPPPAPSNLSAVPYTSTSIKLTWDPVPGATLYRVYGYTYDKYGSYSQLLVSISSCEFIVTGLDIGGEKNHEFNVRTVNAIGTSSPSTVRSYVKPITLTEDTWFTHSFFGGASWSSRGADFTQCFSLIVEPGLYYMEVLPTNGTWPSGSRNIMRAYFSNTDEINSGSLIFIENNNSISFNVSIHGYIILKIFQTATNEDGERTNYKIRYYK